jgi:hypothetical protein
VPDRRIYLSDLGCIEIFVLLFATLLIWDGWMRLSTKRHSLPIHYRPSLWFLQCVKGVDARRKKEADLLRRHSYKRFALEMLFAGFLLAADAMLRLIRLLVD